jgi:hypothetical protein
MFPSFRAPETMTAGEQARMLKCTSSAKVEEMKLPRS